MSRLPQLILSAPLVLCIGAAWAEDKTFDINISAQPLAAALDALAQQTGLQPFYADGIMNGKRSPAVEGRLSAKQALEKLLVGSGLVYHFTATDAVAIKQGEQQLNQSEPTTLPKVSVVGNSVYDVKDPYNADYVLPNATSGTKTDTPIMETPLNVQVVSKQVLKDQQVINLGDALKNVSR
jgi:iron complex outermembrane receptor protein